MRFRHFFVIFCLLLIAAILWGMEGWLRKDMVAPSGGLYFPGELVLDVPQFFQGDPRWGKNPLGPTPATLEAEGCAVASAAMVLASYGVDTDPGRLNHFVREIGGYTPEGWLYWEAAAEYPPALAEKAYEDKASHFLIDWNLLRGNPVIVRIRYPSGITHFVVVVGKRGWDYLIRDPGAGGRKGIYPLKEFGTPIEALRYYRRLDKPISG